MITIISLAVFASVARFLQLIVLNLVGMPGALVAGKPAKTGRYLIGVFLVGLGQAFANLCYVAFVISFTTIRLKADQNGMTMRIIIWVVAFFAVMVPTCITLIKARDEQYENGIMVSAPVDGLYLTAYVTLIGFFVFLFIPTTMKLLWGWIPYVNG